ncbi:hypothetical protein K491DRAFT_687716 [Lophiostoma macrostomum CBS 122681]|uniref:Uncharacterized protein n=1 Tax=Lophiostoma macrostomum CBS 122681 TaxID=1314788 RepID=A0A6A6TRI0_9PLEO|nr:hypothetical protein K491DRAFT_687716 [Lophiostoma macrostomum CBS 122681]
MAGGKYQPLTLTPINFSLTEGTSIPAPPDSPPDTPRPPTPGKGPLTSHPTPTNSFFPQNRETPPPKESTDSAGESQLHETTTNDGNSSTVSPASPSSKRPSSVRKFLGLRPLSSSDSLKSDRPGSPATVDSKPSLTRKKSGSWFGKRKSSFISGPIPEGKENQTPHANGTQTYAKPASPPPRKGPPPPSLPSLDSFGVREDTADFGADDLFKNIK